MLTATSSFLCSGRVPALLMCLGLLWMTPVALAQDFAISAVYSTGTSTGPRAVKVGDVNGDGQPDLIIANINTGVSVLPGLGGGIFGMVSTYPIGTGAGVADGAFNVGLGDVTGDGRMDIVAGGLRINYGVAVLPGLAGGGFGAYQPYAPGLGINSTDLALGDMNGDGRLDIVFADMASSSLVVLLAQAGGGFGAPTLYPTVPNSSPDRLALGDVNGDGRLDIAVTCTNGSTARGAAVLLAQPGGGFGMPVVYNVASNPGNVALGDVNGDGRLDLIVDGVNGQEIGVLPGQAGGNFGAVVSYAAGTTPYGFALGDANNDGLLDVAVIHPIPGSIVLLRGQTGGGFAPAATYSTDISDGTDPSMPLFSSVALADVNGDGHTELVAVSMYGAQAVVLSAAGPLPTVTGFNPPAGGPGSALTLAGRDLTGTQLIRFSGTANNTVSSGFVVNAAGTQINNVIVPAGAVSGPITVQKAGGTATTIGSYTVQGPTATATPDAGAAIQLSPNPAHTTCTLTGLPPTATPATATLHNALGQRVRTVALAPAGGQATVPVAGLPAGVYALRVLLNGQAVVRRLVVE